MISPTPRTFCLLGCLLGDLDQYRSHRELLILFDELHQLTIGRRSTATQTELIEAIGTIEARSRRDRGAIGVTNQTEPMLPTTGFRALARIG